MRCIVADSIGNSLVFAYRLSYLFNQILHVFLYFSKNQPQQQQNDSLMLFVTIIYSSYAFGIMFVACEFGQRLSNAFEEIDDSIEEFDWNLFSHEIQRLLPTILIVTQKPVVFECFGSISALRDTFKKVCIETSYSNVHMLQSN